MITVLECAQLSGHVYQPEVEYYLSLQVESSMFNDIQNILHTKKCPWLRMNDVDPTMQPSTSCYAALYIKFDLNTKRAIGAVVAIRGTDTKFLDNVFVDTVSWFSDVLGNGNKALSPDQYFSKITSFATKAQLYVRRYFPHLQLKFTGHSLGGAIAQLLILRGQFTGSVVAFNAPGVGHFNKVDSFNNCFISNINARYCVIGRVGRIIGKIELIDVPAGAEVAKMLFDNLDSESYQASQALYTLNDRIDDTAIFANPFLALVVKLMTNASAFQYRTNAYAHAYSGLNKSQALQNLIAQNCKNTLLETQTPCAFVTNAKSASAALLEQHSIKNLVQALGKRENARIAYRSTDHAHGPSKCFGQIGAA